MIKVLLVKSFSYNENFVSRGRWGGGGVGVVWGGGVICHCPRAIYMYKIV